MWSCAGRVRSRHGSDFYWVCLATCFVVWTDGSTLTRCQLWDAITVFLELPELAIDPRFSDNDLRMQHRDALHELMVTLLYLLLNKKFEREPLPLGFLLACAIVRRGLD